MMNTTENPHSEQLSSMLKGQLATNGIHDSMVLEAIKAVDRARFVPESLSHVAYVDDDIPLCANRYLLEPLIFAKMLEYAEIESHHRVLDVGAGLGYSSCVIAHMAAQVIAVEESAELVAATRKKLAMAHIQHVDLVTAPMDAGCVAHQPYDRIIIEGAVAEISQTLEEQLAEGGRIVAIRARGRMFATQKTLADIIIGTKHGNRVTYVEKDRVSAYPLRRVMDEDHFFSF